MSAFNASYSHTTVHRQATLDYTKGDVEQLEMLPCWKDCAAVVAPVCHGKSTLAMQFGGYDADELVADEGPHREDDPEWAEYVSCMPTLGGAFDEQKQIRANQIRFTRLLRFFSVQERDYNLPVVYIHTAEYAHLLGLNIIAIAELDLEAIAATSRFDGMSSLEQHHYLESIRKQQSANREYAQRHGFEAPQYYPTYTEMLYSMKHKIETRFASELRPSFYDKHVSPEPAGSQKMDTILLRCARIMETNLYTRAEKAIAARTMFSQFGETAIDITHTIHNHTQWASVIHRVATPAYFANIRKYLATHDRYICPNSEDAVRDAFPLAAGTPKFAVCRIYDWLRFDTTEYDGEAWSVQALVTQGVGDGTVWSYERLLSTLFYDKIISDQYPHTGAVMGGLGLGFLAGVEFAKRGSECHNLVRITGTIFGHEFDESLIGLVTYWNSLAGRSPLEVDIEAEAEARAAMSAPKRYFDTKLNRWSSELFDLKLHEAIVDGYSEATNTAYEKIAQMAEWATDFDEFLKHRKQWVKSGSATGGPKTDLYLRVPAEYRDMVADITEEVAVGVNMALHKVARLRLNKAATFEFPEFVAIVKEALRDYKPNSFTRYFTKKEVGRANPRSLYPATLMHYVVCCFILTLAEKGSPVHGSRQQATEDQQRTDHWLWVETCDHVTALMLDYVSFNEQHERAHLKGLIGSLKVWYSRYGLLTPDIAWAIEWIQESFDQIVLQVGDKHYHFINGLLSGWRMTSFGNSLVNKAYLAVIREQVLEITKKVVLNHEQSGGDDVMSLELALANVHLVLRFGEAMGFSFKAIKQLVSKRYREFFRLFATREGVYGSVCRILGSAASGQWSNSVIGTLVEPSVKIASVMDVLAKVMRRADMPLSFAETFSYCMYEKWARIGDKRMMLTMLHGTTATGGRGIPMADGSMYELEGVEIMRPRESIVEMVGVPYDASIVAVREMVEQAKKYVTADGILPEKEVALTMARKVFHGALAQSQGLGVAQLAVPDDVEYYTQAPKVRKKLTQTAIRDATYEFWPTFNRMNVQLEAAKKASAKLAAIKQALNDKGYATALETIAVEAGVEPIKVRLREEWSLYGFARMALTEDYYNDVVWLATLCADTEQQMNYIASALTTDLWVMGMLHY
ncbi:RNA-dependent RNA polymerase [Fusarium oxysporum f. sp. dianthi mycovirus 1]|uniref:RNA-directed RNA polymerase n=1 Tax=Fusarium oxysporum f. sp. dianthi mycovirus 1 TaxID=1679238 RepID=A0A0H4NWU6_9VIRU|nr:RNA-dependent RNA polymerase [Fusarium oxysporum f. sp. dianthi mycovirus 1]AKP45145.1 RNA-dependent RNA polymerase [Fusarium oxysporum f. sp. dianthi mycovirus 1]